MACNGKHRVGTKKYVQKKAKKQVEHKPKKYVAKRKKG
jgi:hypothetical protein